MSKQDKPLVWLHGEVKSPPFSSEARLEAGFLIRKIQKGDNLSLPHSRPMPMVGKSCHELRIVDVNNTWRIIYHQAEDAIVILEVFAKKTQQTPKKVIDICKIRLISYYTEDDMMNKKRIKELEQKGWKVGGIEDFLELSEEELAYIELKIILSEMVKDLREQQGITQVNAAKILNSSQSRLSKLEAADPSVSIDLQIRSLLKLGATKQEIGKRIGC